MNHILFFNFLGFYSVVASGEEKKSLTLYTLAGTSENLLVKWFDVDYSKCWCAEGACVLQSLEKSLGKKKREGAGKFNKKKKIKMAWPFQCKWRQSSLLILLLLCIQSPGLWQSRRGVGDAIREKLAMNFLQSESVKENSTELVLHSNTSVDVEGFFFSGLIWFEK